MKVQGCYIVCEKLFFLRFQSNSKPRLYIPLAGVGRDVRAGSGFSEYPLLHKSRDLGCDFGCSWSHPQRDTNFRCDRSLWEVCRAQEAPSKLGFTRVDIFNLIKNNGQIAS